MISEKKIRKGLKDLLKEVGDDWEIRGIDFEPCLYRKISDGVDIEVSGVNTNFKKKLFTVFVWAHGGTIIMLCDIKRIELNDVAELVKKYVDGDVGAETKLRKYVDRSRQIAAKTSKIHFTGHVDPISKEER